MNTFSDSTSETICAISTPPGAGGIAVVRISGPAAVKAADAIWGGKPLEAAESHTAHFGRIVDPETAEAVDEAVATVFRGPHSFTGEDTVELSVHGSVWIQSEVLRILTRMPGVRTATAGEFTRRAFASGRIDLAQAEAVADIIASRSRAEARLALEQLHGRFSRHIDTLRQSLLELASLLELELDFAEEHVEFASRERLLELAGETHRRLTDLHRTFDTGQAIKEGIPIAIVGPTNAGKSSLLNALLGHDRAIVSDIHGTTRDIVEDTLTLGPWRIRLMDTAGLRSSSDPIENIGMDRSLNAAREASIVIVVGDATRPESMGETIASLPPELDATIIAVTNKCDLATSCESSPPMLGHRAATEVSAVTTSALTGHGIDTLRDTIIRTIDRNVARKSDAQLIVTNRRHAEALAQAAEAASRVIDALRADIPADLVAQDLRQVLHHLGEITGAITTPDILTNIFTHFCIGK